MAMSEPERLRREAKRLARGGYAYTNHPPAAVKRARLAQRALNIEELLKTQPQASVQRAQSLSMKLEFNQNGTNFSNVGPVLTKQGIMFNAVINRRVISRHEHEIDAFIAGALYLRTTKTYQSNGMRHPTVNAQAKALRAKFQGFSVKVACGMLREAYREAIAKDPTNWKGYHDQLDWEIDLLRTEQDRLAKEMGAYGKLSAIAADTKENA